MDADTHECFFRGCKEVVIGKYHCDRHEAILERQREAQTRRNKEAAAERAQARKASSEYVERLRYLREKP